MKNNFYLYVFMCMAIFSCSKDDDIQEQQTNQFTYELDLSGEINYQEDEFGTKVLIPLTGKAASNSSSVYVRFFQNGQQVHRSALDIQNGNTWMRSGLGDFGIYETDGISGPITAQLEVNGDLIPNTEVPININWPVENLPTITFTTIEQINESGEDISFRIHYVENQIIGGQIKIQPYSNGNIFGDTLTKTLLTENGSFTVSFPEMENGQNYQISIVNTDENNPSYGFIDDNGDVNSMFLFGDITTSESINAELYNPSFLDINATSLKAVGEIVDNVDESFNVIVKWFEGNTEIGQEIIPTNPGASNTPFMVNATGLSPSTTYNFQYYIEGESDPFFVTSTQTVAEGMVNFIFTNVSTEPNLAETYYIWLNNTNNDVVVDLLFFVNGEQTDSSEIILYGNSSITNPEFYTSINYPQNTTVSYEARINDVVIPGQTGSFTTPYLGYSNYQNLNLNGTSDAVNVTSGTAGNLSNVSYTTNGSGNIGTLVFRASNIDGLHPSYYFETLGINNSQNVVASNPSMWTEVSTGVYEISLMNANIPIANGNNSIIIQKSLKNYTVQSTTNTFDEFLFQVLIVDDAGNTVGSASNELSLHFQN